MKPVRLLLLTLLVSMHASWALAGGFQWEDEDRCSTLEFRRSPVSSEAVHYGRCLDSTVSFVQPPTEGVGGWEGRCGPTAVANLTAMRCQGGALAVLEVAQFASDTTPGWRPDTLVNALNRIFARYSASNQSPDGGLQCPAGRWGVVTSPSALTFLKDLSKSLLPLQSKGTIRRLRPDGSEVEISPTPILIQEGAVGMHWVTVVDYVSDARDPYGCAVLMNTYAEQKRMTCQQLIPQANTLLGYVHARFR